MTDVTLAEFLTARLDDKRAWLDSNENRTRNGMCDAPGDHLWEPEAYTEIDAKRKVVELHAGPHECVEVDPAWGVVTGHFVGGDCPTLRLLALPCADHPDYQQEWRPTDLP